MGEKSSGLVDGIEIEKNKLNLLLAITVFYIIAWIECYSLARLQSLFLQQVPFFRKSLLRTQFVKINSMLYGVRSSERTIDSFNASWIGE